jgi:hypothetical protein
MLGLLLLECFITVYAVPYCLGQNGTPNGAGVAVCGGARCGEADGQVYRGAAAYVAVRSG